MKNILILADGSIAKHFVEWVGRKRVADNHYYVTCFNEGATPEKMGKNITLIKADPTSYARIRHIMDEVKFSHVFIVMQNREDELIAASLYDQLPNVPVIAQNVGLGKGEIMEIHVPFGSTYAFRHVTAYQCNDHPAKRYPACPWKTDCS